MHIQLQKNVNVCMPAAYNYIAHVNEFAIWPISVQQTVCSRTSSKFMLYVKCTIVINVHDSYNIIIL